MLNVNLWRIWRPSSRPTLASLLFPAAAHTEAGWMAGIGMRVIAFIPEMVEPEFMYKLFDVVTGGSVSSSVSGASPSDSLDMQI